MRILTLAALLAVVPVPGSGATVREYQVAPAPGWVLPVALPQARSVPTGEVSSGAYWRIVDRQIRADGLTRASYFRYAIELLNETGVEENAQLSFGFDPTYQTLTVHEVRVMRGGRRIDLLPSARTTVLQRETDLESRVYDGSKTLNLVLEDVRVGDVLEYSYSLRGYNPVFGPRFYDSFTMQWSEPVAFARLRLLHPRNKPIRHKPLGGETAPRVRDLGAEQELLWEREHVPALINESDRPDWHVLYPFVQFSESPSWGEVGRWASALFDAHRPSDAALLAQARLGDARALPAAQRVLAALRFVQQEIRYTAIEIGRGSHEPTDPAVVLQRRFGDCKDKSLLLVRLLRALGLQADPVLVDSGSGALLDQLLPSPLAFNHAVVRARLGERDYWLDPTLSTQSGDLEQLHQPDYGFALVVGADTQRLERMPRASSARRTQEVLDVFDLRAGVGEPGMLTVTTAYLAREADRMRTRFASTSRAKIEKDYVNYYARSYPVEPVGHIEIQDDPAANRFRTIERYRLKSSFRDAQEGGKELNLHGYALDDYIRKPDTTMRHTPLAVAHPVNVRHAIEVRLPEPWTIENESGEVRDAAFEFHFKRSYDAQDEILRLEYEYRSLSDHVAPAALAAYLANLDKVDDEYGYWLSYDPDAADRSGYVPAFFLIGLLSLGAGLWLARRLYRYSPPKLAPFDGDSPRGIGGWLILPAIGCFLGPIVSCYLVWAFSLYFDPDAWAGARSVLAPWAQPIAHAYVGTCFALSVVLTCVDAVLLVLFVKKRTAVPRLYPVVLWASTALTALVLFGIDPDGAGITYPVGIAEVARNVVVAAIWTAYFLRSRRVRATFTVRLPEPAPLVPVAPPAGAAAG